MIFFNIFLLYFKVKSKKPNRPPVVKQNNNKIHSKKSDESPNVSSTNSSREKLNGSSDRLSSSIKKSAPIPFKSNNR